MGINQTDFDNNDNNFVKNTINTVELNILINLNFDIHRLYIINNNSTISINIIVSIIEHNKLIHITNDNRDHYHVDHNYSKLHIIIHFKNHKRGYEHNNLHFNHGTNEHHSDIINWDCINNNTRIRYYKINNNIHNKNIVDFNDKDIDDFIHPFFYIRVKSHVIDYNINNNNL
ncbi:Oidioi.mRNA.OKI2018_I69.chr2.g7536.t1.cds [Oikopleura dioica]|uniref:Oidioi.mRNA.OKI2018_I69.chr2.g7536.t1.cds n=1 Tax=Oikopleura dioica TaxID=34765 RepID=A0ABN7TB89_OIKDI|nr:Oidioi.mRNA.OKI2018_I69.chr2.g7536.t1.cds [Oikopleura dioica]